MKMSTDHWEMICFVVGIRWLCVSIPVLDTNKSLPWKPVLDTNKSLQWKPVLDTDKSLQWRHNLRCLKWPWSVQCKWYHVWFHISYLVHSLHGVSSLFQGWDVGTLSNTLDSIYLRNGIGNISRDRILPYSNGCVLHIAPGEKMKTGQPVFRPFQLTL